MRRSPGFARPWRSRTSRSRNAPTPSDYLERVGANHSVLGQLEFRTGHLATARTELEQARAYLERLLHVRPGDVIFRMHLVHCLGLLADVEIESGSTAPALNLARRAVSEAEEILRINPKYHPASQGLADQLLRDAEISWDIGESDRALANLDRAEAILRQLVASHPELTNYRSDLATTIRVHVRMDSEIGRDRDGEPRLREAMALTESVLRDDPDLVMNLPDTAALYSDLATTLAGEVRLPRRELSSLVPSIGSIRHGRDPRGMRGSAACSPGRWRPAPSSWGGSDSFENRSTTGIERSRWPRTPMSSRSASVARPPCPSRATTAPPWRKPPRPTARSTTGPTCGSTSALAHAALSDAIRRDRSLTRGRPRRAVSPPSSRRLSIRSARPGDRRPIEMPDGYITDSATTTSTPCATARLPDPLDGSGLPGATVRSPRLSRSMNREPARHETEPGAAGPV